jgi:hypothetical protein
MRATLFAAAFAVLTTGCLVGEDDPNNPDDLIVDPGADPGVSAFATKGVNGPGCVASPYNCKFHIGGNRVETAAGGESWKVVAGADVRDGNGASLALERGTALTFNFGQTRLLAGKAHALALTTSNGSAGWYPMDHIVDEAAFRAANGNVDAKDPKLGKMACYEIRNSHDTTLELKKVVYDSQVGATGHERAGDYLPLVRANGKRSANLIFSVPGFGLGGATTDHFPAGTKFQRVDVPTDSGRPSISIPLWVKDGAGAYKQQSGTMRFLYGYVVASDGVKRFGWMAQDAVMASSGCP